MTEYEKKRTKAEIREKIDKNSINIKLNAGAAIILAAMAAGANTILTLCGFSSNGTLVGSIIVYCAAAFGIPNYIRHVARLYKERKKLKQEMEKTDE